MLPDPKVNAPRHTHGMIALNIRRAFACRASADSDGSDSYRWSFRHAVIRAAATAVVIVVLVIVCLL